MPDLSQLLEGLGLLLVAAVLLWFTVGTQTNIRKGNRVMRWLQAGLPAVGPRATVRWLGSSVAELRILEPRAPYRAAELKIVLEPRDVGALWALARSRGRRDFLLLRADLVRAPLFRAELVAPHAWTAGDRRADDAPFDREEPWTDAAGGAVTLRADRGADTAALQRAWDVLQRQAGGMWRISVRPLVPHLELHLRVPALERTDARALLETIGELAETLSRRH